MRNLRLLRNINLQNPQLTEANKYCVVNVNDCGDLKSTRIQCFTFGNDFKVYRVHIRGNVVEKRDLIVDLTKSISDHENITVVEWTYLFNHLYIILSDGQFVTAFLEGEDIEVKSDRLNFNIKCVSWSPDVSRTAIVDDNDILHVLQILDNSYKTVSESTLQNECEEQNSFINVGWGSIETQFRGSEGKYSKIQPTAPQPQSITEESCSDSSVNICWKQNCTSFAVTYLRKSESIRRVKIFSQDGVLLNVTKDICGLCSPIDWCSSKNLISLVQKLPNKRVVCFLEQNALKHGDFQIKDGTEVLQLRWNLNGNILACHERDQRGEVISLWITSNYKWYQKQCLNFSNQVLYLQWDYDVPNRLHVVLESGTYRMYEWIFQVTESNQYNKGTNPCFVAVINDRHLNLTPYRQVCQPPSMPHVTHSVPASINAIIFANINGSPEQANCHSTLLYLSNNECVLLNCENSKLDSYYFNLGDVNTEIEFETPLEMSNWLWMFPDSLYFSWSRTDGNYFCASHLDLKTKSIVVRSMFKLDSIILSIANYESDIIVHTEDGAMYLLHDNQFLPMTLSLIEPWIQFQALSPKILIGLSEHRNLYINETIKERDVLSFYWRPPFLVLIKMSSQLLITKVQFSDGKIKFSEVQIRQIEQKSNLVTIVDDQVMLEMERGNLEVIRPRPFVIFRMEQMLSEEKYYEVFKMLRKQRINLNVIFDHNPKTFLKNVKNIVKNVSDPMYLSTFVTEVVDENVAKIMFPWKYSDIADVYVNKVHLICETLISSIKECSIEKFINPLIAALVRQGKLTKAADYAIKYDEIASFCHLADPVAAYKAALGSYDLSCALRIVQHSKLDPSEYLPFIRELEATEENYRKFKICNYLERYGEALKHIAECPDKYDECIAYIHKHGLYSIALDIFSEKNKSVKPADPKYIQVLTIVADSYFNDKLYEEASVLYEKAQVHEKAYQCYLAIGEWFAAISTITRMNDQLSTTEVYNSLHDALLKRGQYVDAGFVAFHYSKNCKQAVSAFLKAKKYCSALNAAIGLGRESMIGDIIQPQLLVDVKGMIEHLQSHTQTIKSYAQRLYYIRERKQNREAGIADDGESSVSSFATSTTTESTASLSSLNSRTSTSSSAKRLRRQERKLWNLKKNNPREEPSIVATLKELFTCGDKVYAKQISDLSKALIRTDEIERARELKTEYLQFLKFLQQKRDRIWPTGELTEGGFKDISIQCPPDIMDSNRVLKLL